MFSLLNRLSDFSPPLLAHLEARLGSSLVLQDLTSLRMDIDDREYVVLASWQRGVGIVRHRFPAALLRDPALRPDLDRAIEAFLSCWPATEGAARGAPREDPRTPFQDAAASP
jgi:hypothetical protein